MITVSAAYALDDLTDVFRLVDGCQKWSRGLGAIELVSTIPDSYKSAGLMSLP
jgi:hypothetical protein